MTGGSEETLVTDSGARLQDRKEDGPALLTAAQTTPATNGMPESDKMTPTDTLPSVPMNAPSTPSSPAAKRKPGEVWKAKEVHEIPHNNLYLVGLGLMLSVFLAALDQTILAVTLPTIIDDFGGDAGSGYSWAGSAYLLAAACMTPLYAKLADMYGRKPIIIFVIGVFMVGSALCGAAQNITWLDLCRALQGAGGGGIIAMAQITISDIVTLEQRGKFSGMLGTVWGVASASGPLIGGALAERASWRWCFFINLPTGGIAAAIIFFCLHLNPKPGRTLRQHAGDFDFIGLMLIMGGVAMILIGFQHAETTWKDAETIGLIVGGGVSLILAGIWECYTTRSPILPPRLFHTRTTAIILITVLLHAIVFFTGAYFLPLYYQILGASPIIAGVKMFPYNLGASLTSIVAGFLIVKTQSYLPMIRIAYVVFLLGQGLMIMLDANSSLAAQVCTTLVAGIGLGPLFQAPLLGLQAAMPLRDMATATGAFALFRMVGGSIGITLGGALYASGVRSRLDQVPTYAIDAENANSLLGINVSQLQYIQPPSLSHNVEQVFSKGIQLIWIVMTPLVGVALILTMFQRNYSLKRASVQLEKVSKTGTVPVVAKDKVSTPSSDLEKQEMPASAVDEQAFGAQEEPEGEAPPGLETVAAEDTDR